MADVTHKMGVDESFARMFRTRPESILSQGRGIYFSDSMSSNAALTSRAIQAQWTSVIRLGGLECHGPELAVNQSLIFGVAVADRLKVRGRDDY
jgi:hypothetical protein